MRRDSFLRFFRRQWFDMFGTSKPNRVRKRSLLYSAEFLEPRIAPAILPPVIVSATPINDSTLVDFASFTGTVTTGSQSVTAVSSISGLYVGESISGTGIPTGTSIQKINNTTTLTLSSAATMTGINEALNANATTIQVTYSEEMTASAADPANYVLLGPNDTPIPITSASFTNPSAAITSVSWAAGVETVTANNAFTNGESVTISGMTPAALDGTFTITSVSPTQFTYAAATNPDPGIAITAETWANGVETVTTATNPGFTVGESVTISGETPASLNGTVTVASVMNTAGPPPVYQFTYAAATNPNPSVAITSENWASGVETVYANNSFLTGETVVIAGETPTGAPLNGTFTIASASATQFTYDALTNPGTPTAFGTATATTFGAVAPVAFGTASAAAAPDTTVQLTFNTGATITGATWTQEATDYTAASWASGVETITADNTFVAGQTVELTGTLNGDVTIESATGTQFTYDVGANPFPVSQVDPVTGTLWTPEVAAITGLSWTNGVATVTAANTFQVGQSVVISNMAPASLNGTVIVTSATPTQFTYDVDSNPGAATGFGIASSGLETIDAFNAFVAGQTVVLSDMAPLALDGSVTVVAASPVGFTYYLATNPGAATSLGNVTAPAGTGVATGGLETITVTNPTAANLFAPNESVLISGMTPSSFDGAVTVLTDTLTTFTYAGSPTNPGTPTGFGIAVPSLVGGAYTLYAQGASIFAANGLPMSETQEFVAANASQNNFATSTVSNGSSSPTGALNALSNYSVPSVSGNLPNPAVLSEGDFTGNGIPDLVVVDQGTNRVDIYLGRPSSAGGGFNQLPNLVLDLPPATLNVPDYLVVTDLTNNADPNNPDLGFPDIAVANGGSNSVTVFDDTSANGLLTFSLGSTFALTGTPLGMVSLGTAGDGVQYANLAVLVGGAGGDQIDILANLVPLTGLDGFAEPFIAGNLPGNTPGGLLPGETFPPVNATSGVPYSYYYPVTVSNPTSIAAGSFDTNDLYEGRLLTTGAPADDAPDIAVGGTSGVQIFIEENEESPTFMPPFQGIPDPGYGDYVVQPNLVGAIYTTLPSGAPVLRVSLQAGTLGGTNGSDLVDIANNGQVEVLTNSGFAQIGTFNTTQLTWEPMFNVSSETIGTGTDGTVGLGDLADNGLNDIVITSGTQKTSVPEAFSGDVSVLLNSGQPGATVAGTLTLSAKATTSGFETLTATSTITNTSTMYTGIVTSGSLLVTDVTSPGGLAGLYDGEAISGTGIPAGTTIATLNLANVTLTSATSNPAVDGGNIIVTTQEPVSDSGLVSGGTITITGSTYTPANGTWVVEVLGPTTLELLNSAQTMAGGVTLQHDLITAESFDVADNTMTVMAKNTFTVGQVVEITNVLPDDPDHDGFFTVTGTDATTPGGPATEFTYSLTIPPSLPPLNYVSGGTASSYGGTFTYNPFYFAPNPLVTDVDGTPVGLVVGDTQHDVADITDMAWGADSAKITAASWAPNTVAVTGATWTPQTATITAITWANGLETIFADNTFVAGQSVIIAGMTPATLNGTVVVVSANATQFTYAVAVNPGTATAFGTAKSGIETILAANTFEAGQTVVITGMTPAALNGTFTIISATATSFTYSIDTNPGTATVFGTATVGIVTITAPNNFEAGQTVVVTGMTPAGYNGTYTIVSANDTEFTYALATNPGAATVLGAAAIGIETVTTDDDNFTVGQTVVIEGMTPATLDGAFTILTVDQATHSFTYAVEPDPGTPTAFGTASGNEGIITANQTGEDFSLLYGNGNGTFATSSNTTEPGTVTGPEAVGDLNGDGYADLVEVNTKASAITTVSIYAGLAGGGFAATPITFNANKSGLAPDIVDVIIANVTGSAYPEIILVDQADNEIDILANNITTAGTTISAASFTAMTPVSVGSTPYQVVAADFTKNGLIDLAVAHDAGSSDPAGDGITILLNTGSQTTPFNAANTSEVATGDPVQALVTADFNDDGIPDIAAVENSPGGGVVLLLGKGNGTFITRGPYNSNLPPDLDSIAVGNFNDDGYPDVVVGSASTNPTLGGAAILLNQHGTGFGSGIHLVVSPGTGIQSVAVSDLTGNGIDDIIASTILPSYVNGTISNATNTAPIIITDANNGLKTGDQIEIDAVGGNVNANGIWTITVINANQFSLNGSNGYTSATNGGYTPGTGIWQLLTNPPDTNDNVFVLYGSGDAVFDSTTGYELGNVGVPFAPPTTIIATPSPTIPVTTFFCSSNSAASNLINNGTFAAYDLSDEQGNLDGWTTYEVGANPTGGSYGSWSVGTDLLMPLEEPSTAISPLSGTPIPDPTNSAGDPADYEAVLDEGEQTEPYVAGTGDPNPVDTYQGTHLLYQDVNVPANAATVDLSLDLYVDETDNGGFTDPTVDPSLNFSGATAAGQTPDNQVSVDLMADNNGLVYGASNGSPIVITTGSTAGLQTNMNVTIANVTGDVAANGTWTITVINGTQFSLNGSNGAKGTVNGVGNGPFSGGGTWSLPILGTTTADGLIATLFQTTPDDPTQIDTLVTADGADIAETGPITGATNAAPIVITTPYNPALLEYGTIGLFTGMSVTIAGVEGNTAANGTWAITVISPTTFSLNGSTGVGGGAYTTGGTWSLTLLSAIEGRGVELRVASVNNAALNLAGVLQAGPGVDGGRMIVAVNNVSMNVTFVDTTAPTITGKLGGSNITAASWAGGVETITEPNNFAANQTVVLSGMTPASLDGSFTILSATATQFTIAEAANPGTPTVFGTATSIGMQNGALVGGANATIPYTADPTIVGTVNAAGGVNNIEAIEFSPNNDGFTGAFDVFDDSTFDADGDFSFTIPVYSAADPTGLTPGLHTVGIQVVDDGGNVVDTSYTFFLLDAGNISTWTSDGPVDTNTAGQTINGTNPAGTPPAQPTEFAGEGVDFASESGQITVTVPDVRDPTGNSYFVASQNGGIWHTSDGGADWAPLTSYVYNANGSPVAIPIGGLAQSKTNPDVLYAGTGVGNQQLDTEPGIGVLKTTNAGETWTVVGNSGTVLAGAYVTDVVISANNSLDVYVAVAEGGEFGPGVYLSTDGGTTWTIATTPATMYLSTDVGDITNITYNAGVETVTENNEYAAGETFTIQNMLPASLNVQGTILSANATSFTFDTGTTPAAVTQYGTARVAATGINVAAGTALASVTSLIIDPFNSNRLIMGMGNIGMVAASSTAGVWLSIDNGQTWTQELGGDTAYVNTMIPFGLGVGKVTVAIGSGRVGDEANVFVAVGTPPTVTSDPYYDLGNFEGLYFSNDNMLDFTRVIVNINASANPVNDPIYIPITLFANDSANVGTMEVDPTQPTVVYVAGSYYLQSGDQENGFSEGATAATNLEYEFIRVDVSDIILSDAPPSTTFPNATSASQLEEPWAGNDFEQADFAVVTQGYEYRNPAGAVLAPYTGEGVYWYDLNTGSENGPANNAVDPGRGVIELPQEITSLAFDSMGRLLVGTSGGLFRGLPYGFSYDFTSGSTGILTEDGYSQPDVPGANFTGLNGNLSIAALTSIAIDPTTTPTTQGNFYTSTYDTGFQDTTTYGGSISQGLNEDWSYTGANIVAAAPLPGSPPGDVPTLFRDWEFVQTTVPNGLINLAVDESTDDGNNFLDNNNNGINTFQPNTVALPPLSLDVNPIYESGLYEDQLLLGSQVVYLTRTTGSVWDAVGTGAQLGSGNITTLANAPSLQGVYYAGEQDGQIFVTKNNGADGFVEIDTGLPKTAVNNITVDPNNAAVAIAVFAAGPNINGYVYETSNFGATWTNISGSLPNVAAYDLAFDTNPDLGAPYGKVYVGTQNGVYYTTNDSVLLGGTPTPVTWKKIGGGLPNAPAVTLAFNFNEQILAVGTLGLGMYTVSTKTLSDIPNQNIPENQTSSPIPITINDPGLPAGSYTVTITSSNGTLIPNSASNLILAGSGANRTLTIVPTANAYGTSQITVTVAQAGVVTQTINFLVTVNISKQVIEENGSLTLNFGPDTVTSANSGNLVAIPDANLIITLANGEPATVSGGGPLLTITPAAGQTGTSEIEVFVTDPSGQTSIQYVQVLVTAPVALPFSDTFDQPASPFLGVGWNEDVGDFSISNEQGQANDATNEATLDDVIATATTQQVTVNLTNGQTIGLVSRYTGSGSNNQDFGRISATATGYTASIYQNINGTFNLLSSNTYTGAASGILLFQTEGPSLELWFNDVLIAYANDSTLTSGSVGIRASQGVTFTDYSASAVVMGTPTLPYTDAFDNASNPSGQLSTNWINQAGYFQINPSTGNVTAVNGLSTATLYGLNASNVSEQINVTLSTNEYASLVARYSGPAENNEYFGGIIATATGYNAFIDKIVGGVTTNLVVKSYTGSADGLLLFQVNGPSLKVYFGGTLAASASDSSLTTGSAGIQASPGAVVSTYDAASLTPTTATLAFTDSFSTITVPAGQLDTYWLTQAGNFTINTTAGTATGATGPSVATLDGLSVANVSVSASVAVSTNEFAGLVLRYSGMGVNDEYYLAGILGTATGYKSTLYLVENGVYTTLFTQSYTGSASGPLVFTAVGPYLELSFNNTLIAYADDTTLSAGSVGMQGNTGAVLSNFAASVPSVGTPTLPFTDPFNTTTTSPANQLTDNWLTETGNFQVNTTNGTATAAGPKSLAILNGLSTSNLDVSATVTVPAGQHAGVVSRYSGTGVANMYYAALFNTATGFEVNLYRFVNGVPTLLQGTNLTTAPTSNTATISLLTEGKTLSVYYNGTLIDSLLDPTVGGAAGPGSAGMLGTTGTIFSNFAATAVLPSTQPLPFSDNFSTAATTPPNGLDSSWTTVSGSFQVNTTAETATGASTTSVAIVTGINAPNVDVSATVTLTAGQVAGLVARYSGIGQTNYYLGILRATSTGYTSNIYLNQNGTYTLLYTQTFTGSANGTLLFQVYGPSLELYLNGNLVGYADDGTLTAGSVGIYSNSSAVLSAFKATALTVATPSNPFSDMFNTVTTPAGQLDSNWINEAGYFTVNTTNGTATGLANEDTAIVVGSTGTDEQVSANIALSAVGQNAGLVTRYSGPGDNNEYFADIKEISGTSYTAYIFKLYNGVFTDLFSQTITATATGAMVFQAQGPSLELFLNNKIIGYANDTTLTSGEVGIRTSAGVALSSFAADEYTVAAPTLPFNDQFTLGTTPSGQLDLYWNNQVGDFLVNTAATPHPTATGMAAANWATVNTINVANVQVQANIAPATGQSDSLLARYTGSGNTSASSGYIGKVVATSATSFTAYIYKDVNGTVTQLYTNTYFGTSTGTLLFQLIGPSLDLYFDGNLIANAVDATLTSGSVGMAANAGSAITQFSAVAITLTTPTLPFTDTFNTVTTPPDQLSTNWVTQSGNFAVNTTAGNAAATGKPDLATLYGLSVANVQVQADFSVGLNENAGLVSRYAGPGVANFYATLIVNTSAGIYVNMYKNVNGTYTLMGSQLVASAESNVNATLELLTVGDTVTAIYNGNTLYSVVDTTFTGPGSAGVLSAGGAVVSDFTVAAASAA